MELSLVGRRAIEFRPQLDTTLARLIGLQFHPLLRVRGELIAIYGLISTADIKTDKLSMLSYLPVSGVLSILARIVAQNNVNGRNQRM
jgi:hypothetical protein